MSIDEEGVDTIFGALTLILVCMIASALLLSSPSGGTDRSRDAQWAEDCLDCILSTTIELPCGGPEDAAVTAISISDYLVRLSAGRQSSDSPQQAEVARREIALAVDFYMSRFDGWSLQLAWNGDEAFEVASRSPDAMAGSETYVVERVISESDGDRCAIRFASTR